MSFCCCCRCFVVAVLRCCVFVFVSFMVFCCVYYCFLFLVYVFSFRFISFRFRFFFFFVVFLFVAFFPFSLRFCFFSSAFLVLPPLVNGTSNSGQCSHRATQSRCGVIAFCGVSFSFCLISGCLMFLLCCVLVRFSEGVTARFCLLVAFYTSWPFHTSTCVLLSCLVAVRYGDLLACCVSCPIAVSCS